MNFTVLLIVAFISAGAIALIIFIFIAAADGLAFINLKSIFRWSLAKETDVDLYRLFPYR